VDTALEALPLVGSGGVTVTLQRTSVVVDGVNKERDIYVINPSALTATPTFSVSWLFLRRPRSRHFEELRAKKNPAGPFSPRGDVSPLLARLFFFIGCVL
jgi:hypothetical protein